MYKDEYRPPTLTVDAVVFQLIDDQLSVLLIERAAEPFANYWALPGIYSAAGETTRQSLERVLVSKAGVSPNQIHVIDQLYTFDTVARDPRGHAVSVSYLCLGDEITPNGGRTTQKPTFFAVDQLPELAFDHYAIIDYARKRLASKITYTNIISALLPNEFTLSELQTAHEAILGRSLDKRNFRKKILGLDLIVDTGKSRSVGAHRPAKLYRFRTRELQELNNNFLSI